MKKVAVVFLMCAWLNISTAEEVCFVGLGRSFQHFNGTLDVNVSLVCNDKAVDIQADVNKMGIRSIGAALPTIATWLLQDPRYRLVSCSSNQCTFLRQPPSAPTR